MKVYICPDCGVLFAADSERIRLGGLQVECPVCGSVRVKNDMKSVNIKERDFAP